MLANSAKDWIRAKMFYEIGSCSFFLPFDVTLRKSSFQWCHDTQHDNIWHNGNQHNYKKSMTCSIKDTQNSYSRCWVFLCRVLLTLSITYTEYCLWWAFLSWVLNMLSVGYAECFYAGCFCAECFLCWVLFMLGVVYAECCLCWLSFVLTIFYAQCHSCLVAFMLGVIYT